MTTRVASKDEGDGKGGKSDGNGNKEGNCKEEGNWEQRGQRDHSNRDNKDNHNDNGNEYNANKEDTGTDNKDNNTDGNNNGVVAAACSGWRWRGRATKAVAVGLSVHIFFNAKFWVVLVVGKAQGRQAGSLKYPTGKVCILMKLALLLWAKKIV
jgi:hypothetical protein